MVIDEHIHETSITEIKKFLNVYMRGMRLPDKALSYSLKTFYDLIEAEYRIHRISGETIYIPELISANAYFDIIGVFMLLDELCLLTKT